MSYGVVHGIGHTWKTGFKPSGCLPRDIGLALKVLYETALPLDFHYYCAVECSYDA